MKRSLVYLMVPEQRREPEEYISERAKLNGLRALNKENLSQASPLALANLLTYFDE